MSGKTVLVTGASGYIAAHVVQQLQREGYRVRATVRSLASAEKTQELRQLVPDALYPLQLVEADLTRDDGWDEAVSGCWAVLHTASPLPDIFTKTQAPGELVGPATGGTRRVLEAASRAGVERVVLTSSVAAVMGGYTDLGRAKKRTEADWTDPEAPDVNEYARSKTLAEKEAWRIHDSLPEKKRFTLAVINPSFVLGPPLLRANAHATSVSFVTKIITRQSFIFPDIYMPMCDVRDVAAAHLKALTMEAAAGHRHIISNTEELTLPTLPDIISEELTPYGYSISNWRLPYLPVYIASFFLNKLAEVEGFWQKSYNLCNKRMVEVLGVRPVPYRNTIRDTLHAVIKMGMVPETEQYRLSKK